MHYDHLPGLSTSTGSLSMDPVKVETVTSWPQPEDRKALQRFLGFAKLLQKVHQEL